MVLVRPRFIVALFAAGFTFAALAYAAPRGESETDARAYDLARAGDAQGAADLYTTEIAQEPGNFIFYLRRGLTYIQMKDFEHGLADLSDAIRLNPNKLTDADLGQRVWDAGQPETHLWHLDVEAHTVRANVLEALGRYDEALVDLDYAVTIDSRGLDIRHHRGVLRTLAGRYNDAIADFDFVLSHGAHVETAFARGLAKYMQEDWTGAATDFRTAATGAPNNGKYTWWLGKAQFKAEGFQPETQPAANATPAAPEPQRKGTFRSA